MRPVTCVECGNATALPETTTTSVTKVAAKAVANRGGKTREALKRPKVAPLNGESSEVGRLSRRPNIRLRHRVDIN
jgi:hypothetical protein